MSGAAKSLTYATNVWRVLTEEPREANTEGGIFPAIFGTVMMVLIMTVVVVPFGVVAVLYKVGILVVLVALAISAFIPELPLRRTHAHEDRSPVVEQL